MIKTVHLSLQKHLILPVSFLFGLSLMISLSGMEILSFIIILIVLTRFHWFEIKLKDLYRPDLLSSFSLIFFCLLSLIINGHSEDIFPYFFKFRWILFFYFLSLFFRLSEKALYVFFVGLVLGLAISSVNSILQFITNWDIVRQISIPYNAISSSVGHVTRVTSFFNLPTTYGYSLSMILIIPLAYLFHKKSIKKALPMILVFLSGLASLVLTYTRGAWIGFLCAFFYFIWLANKKVIILLTPLLLILGVLLYAFQPGFQERTNSLLNLKYKSNNQRIELWIANWHIFKDHPLFGVGLHKNDKLVENYHKSLGHKHNVVSHAHNTYLQLLAGTGLFGFISLMVFFIFIIKQILKNLRSHFHHNIITRIAFLSILLSFLVGCLFDCNLRDAEVRYMFISLLSVFFFISKNQEAFRQKQSYF